MLMDLTPLHSDDYIVRLVEGVVHADYNLAAHRHNLNLRYLAGHVNASNATTSAPSTTSTTTTVNPRSAEVFFNGYQCLEQGSPSNRSNHTIQCLTSPRSAGIKPSSFSVRIPGKGFAFRMDRLRVFYRYLDKWSDPRNWLNEERPVEGDSAWVPDGQAIMVDVNVPR